MDSDREDLTFTTVTSGSGGASRRGSDHQHAYLIQDARRDSHDEDMDDGGYGNGELREQDRFLPIANVTRIMKKAIPPPGKIAKDARECVQECVSEFISFITSEASDRCQAEKRKTINGEDILFAMSSLGFDNYVEPLKLYLQKYREAMKGDKQGTEGYDDISEDVLSTSALQGLTSAADHASGSSGQVLITYSDAPNIQSFQL